MSIKEQVDFLLSKVDDDKKAEFLAELKMAVGLDAWITVLQKFGVSLTDEEMQKLQGGSHELSDDDLDVVSGGCGCGKNQCNNLTVPGCPHLQCLL